MTKLMHRKIIQTLAMIGLLILLLMGGAAPAGLPDATPTPTPIGPK